LEQLDIPLPPLDEQRRIAAILDQADALRRKRQLGIAQISSLGKAIFNQMFDLSKLRRKSFSDLVEIQSGLVDPKEERFADLPHIGPEHIESGSGELLNYRTAREDAVISGKFLFDNHCILYSKIRPNLNKVALAPSVGLCSADVYPLKVRSNVANRVYVWFLLRSDDFLNYASGFSNRANIPKLNKEQVLGYMAPAPGFDLQERFANRISCVISAKISASRSLVHLDSLFASLQHRGFRGEL